MWLKTHGYKDFIAEKTFNDCVSDKGRPLRFDFYIPSSRILIEFDGEQHYTPTAFGRGLSPAHTQRMYERQIAHDRTKDEYAITNGYKLIRIKYDESVYEKLSELL